MHSVGPMAPIVHGDGLGPASTLIFGAFAVIATLISVDALFLVLIDNWLWTRLQSSITSKWIIVFPMWMLTPMIVHINEVLLQNFGIVNLFDVFFFKKKLRQYDVLPWNLQRVRIEGTEGVDTWVHPDGRVLVHSILWCVQSVLANSTELWEQGLHVFVNWWLHQH